MSKYLRMTTTASSRRAILWDDAGTSATIQEVLAKVRSDTLGTSAIGGPGVVLRASGGASSETGYSFNMPSDAKLEVSSFASGTAGFGFATAAGSTSTATWYWIRARVNGSTIQARRWADGDAEPGTWDIDTTNTAIEDAGGLGFTGGAVTGNADCDFFSYGLAGDAAPDPA